MTANVKTTTITNQKKLNRIPPTTFIQIVCPFETFLWGNHDACRNTVAMQSVFYRRSEGYTCFGNDNGSDD